LASYLLRFVDGLPQQPLLLTGGLSASKLSKAVWSPSGKTLGITRDDGFFLIDIDAKDQVTQTELDTKTQDTVYAWFKSDTDIVFAARNVVSQKFTIALAHDSGADWVVEPIVVDVAATTFFAASDASLVSYIVPDVANMQATAWSVETVKGATPIKIVGPLVDFAVQASLDGKSFTMATTAKSGGVSTVFAGPMTMLSTPPVLKSNLALQASNILPRTLGSGWANDAKHAAIFQPAGSGRQLVLYEPGAAQTWNPLAVQQVAGPGPIGDPAWSPDNKVLALLQQPALDASAELMLVSTETHTVRSLVQTAKGGHVFTGKYSAGGEFLSYQKSDQPSPTTFAGGLVDLRQGLAKATTVPLDGTVSYQGFAAHSLDFVYGDAGGCYYIDLSGTDPGKRVRVNGAGDATTCSFQVLPK
jgi:dipeptidyl aminopeptidase/acylaminoacyl peptidase